MRKGKRIFFMAITMAVFTIGAIGCQTERPYITITVKPDRTQVIPGEPIELHFQFKIDSDFKGIPYNGYVFVHFYDPLGNQAFVADHLPPKPTSEWKAGDTVEYDHLVFVPDYIYPGEYQIVAGIYDFEGVHDRIPMRGEATGHRAYHVADLEVLPPPPYPNVRYVDGWYEPELNPNDPTQRWRWTQKRAVALLVNPKRKSRLFIEVESNKDVFDDHPQELTLTLNGKELDRFKLDRTGPQLKIYTLTPDQLGGEDNVELVLELDQTFVPAKVGLGQDDRELGIRIYHLVLQPLAQ